MAISYSLGLATPLAEAEVAHELNEVAQSAGLFDALVSPEVVLAEGVATRRGMWNQVFEEKPQPWNPVVADLGITPSVSVMFTINRDTEIPEQQDDMVRLVAGLLDRVPGDMVLHFQYEVIWLLRRDGGLDLHERDDLWPARACVEL